MKTCTKCKIELPLDMFSKRNDRPCGYRGNCKQCDLPRNIKYRVAHPWIAKPRKKKDIIKRKLYLKQYAENNRDKEKKKALLYAKKNKLKIREAVKKYARNNPSVRKAHNILNNSIRSGETQKGTTCLYKSANCGGRIEAHHDNYKYPLKVSWTCKKHHEAIHRVFEVEK